GGAWLPALLAVGLGASMLWLAPDGLTGKLDLWENLPRWPGTALVFVGIAVIWLGRKAAWRMAALATLGAALFALAQFYVSDNLWRRYDIRPMAREIKRLQDRGSAVANNGDYHAQYQFFGRLEHPLHELGSPAEIRPWFDAHPDGALILYVTPQPGEAAPLFSQPYLGEAAVLLNAEQLRARGWLK
ncbi:MAG: glycosyltransferase family 39 protein, partial [Candidatus Desulfobacillus denitrificans]